VARKLRIEYAGAAYHVMARGNQGRDVCGDERDHKLKGIRLRVTDRGLCPSLRVVVYCEYFVAFGGAGSSVGT
jgi:hypothetical protein